MSTLDKWLPLWIGLAMVVGLLLGRFVPALSDFLARLEVGGISVPIGIGLLVMMYPVLAPYLIEINILKQVIDNKYP